MRCFKIILFLVVLSLTNLSFSNADSIVLESTFDNDNEGWGIRGEGSDITYHASGGNPYTGGFISAEDRGSESWFFLAPDTWAGDWTSYIGGIISFDLKLISGDTNAYWSDVDIIIETEDIGNYATWSSGIDPGLGTWTHYEVRISESNFEIVGNRTWNEILSNVTNLLIRGEHILGSDTEGIDNIQVVDSLGIAEIISTFDDGIWYWDFVTSAWTQMTDFATDGVIASGDFTGDGKADVASSWEDFGLWYQDWATLGWTKIVDFPAYSLTAGDVTGDGRFEIISTWPDGIWYWDVAASTWTQMTSYATDGDIASGDFTGDGKADVASIWSDGLWYQDGATLAWTKISDSAPDSVTCGNVSGN
jgi:hypothetical protein